MSTHKCYLRIRKVGVDVILSTLLTLSVRSVAVRTALWALGDATLVGGAAESLIGGLKGWDRAAGMSATSIIATAASKTDAHRRVITTAGSTSLPAVSMVCR